MAFTGEQRELIPSSRLELSDLKTGAGHQSIPRLGRSSATLFLLESLALWAQGFQAGPPPGGYRDRCNMFQKISDTWFLWASRIQSRLAGEVSSDPINVPFSP